MNTQAWKKAEQLDRDHIACGVCLSQNESLFYSLMKLPALPFEVLHVVESFVYNQTPTRFQVITIMYMFL